MKKLCFYGASDDLFEFNKEDGSGDEIGCYNRPGVYKITDHKNNGLYVTAMYAPEGVNAPVWSIGVALLEEDVPLPEWPFYFRLAENGYSPVLVIYAPDSVVVEAAAS